MVATAAATFLVTALLVNIFERKSEARNPYVLLEEVGEDDTDPAKWGVNWPREYDSYKRTAISTRTRFGGHGGSDTVMMRNFIEAVQTNNPTSILTNPEVSLDSHYLAFAGEEL